MIQLPYEFKHEFDSKGDSFHSIAATLYKNPDQQYTQTQLSEEVDITPARVSQHLSEMEGWIDEEENNPILYRWNRDRYDPLNRETTMAVTSLYRELWFLLQRHSRTVPGVFAIFGLGMFSASLVMIGIYIGFSLSITPQSDIPSAIYLLLALGGILSGMAITILAPVQALVNRTFDYLAALLRFE